MTNSLLVKIMIQMEEWQFKIPNKNFGRKKEFEFNLYINYLLQLHF